jgi:hypothetical protein
MSKKNRKNLETPVLFLIFNRPDTTEKVFKEIRKARPKKLFIASDGPRGDKNGEREIVERTRRMVLNMIDWDCEVKKFFRNKNLGCKYAVSGAIDWFFRNVEEGIILEDDCLPSQSFFWYCQELLKKYRTDERVMCISGNCFFDKKRFNEFSYYFFSVPLVWGWATWKRAWGMYDVEMRGYKKFLEKGTIRDAFPNKMTEEYFKKIFDKTYDKKINTWDYQWSFACLSNNGLVCVPCENLISNIGFSEEATHTKNKPKNKDYIFYSCDLKFPLIHPDFILKNKRLEIGILKKHFGINIKSFIKNEIIKSLKIFGTDNAFEKLINKR